MFGTLKAGLVMANTNPLYTTAEMVHQFTDSGAVGLIVIDLFATKVAEVLPKTSIRTVVVVGISDLLPPLKRLLVSAVQKYVKKMVPPITFAHTTMTRALAQGADRIAAGADPQALRAVARAQQHRGAAVHRRHDRRRQGRGAHARQSRRQHACRASRCGSRFFASARK